MSVESAAVAGSDGTAENPTGSLPVGEDQNLPIPLPEVMTLPSTSFPSGSPLPTTDQPRKRKGHADDRQPHSQIEKRRRDKMNNLIDELAAMVPACNLRPRKHDKLTVLRMAVQHLRSLKGGSRSFASTSYKPWFLSQDDLKDLVLRATEGFLLVVSCDRGKILFTSESVFKTLNFSQLELDGQSLFDYVHPKDTSKLKEQLSASEMYPQERLIDAKKFQQYCTVHCTGYMRSWPSSQSDTESDVAREGSCLTCLVAVCRVHPHTSCQPTQEVNIKPTEFVTRYAIDGKFTFVDQQATTVTGYLPQELLGTSCYEHIHQEDLPHLAERHRTVLRSKEKIGTRCYKFKTKDGSFVMLQSQWFSFINPCTKEVEFIVSTNRVVSRPGHTSGKSNSSTAFEEDSKHILPIIPGMPSSMSTMVYAGSIGTHIANELIDSNRINSSPSSGNASPFCPLDMSPSVPFQASCVSNTEDTPGRSGSQSQAAAAFSGDETLIDTGEASQLDLDSTVVPGLSNLDSTVVPGLSNLDSTVVPGLSNLDSTVLPGLSNLDSTVLPGLSNLSSDEATMAAIMSLLETDASLGDTVDFDDMHWSL